MNLLLLLLLAVSCLCALLVVSAAIISGRISCRHAEQETAYPKQKRLA